MVRFLATLLASYVMTRFRKYPKTKCHVC